MSKKHPGLSEPFKHKQQVRAKNEPLRLLNKEAKKQANLDKKTGHKSKDTK